MVLRTKMDIDIVCFVCTDVGRDDLGVPDLDSELVVFPYYVRSEFGKDRVIPSW